MKNILFFLFALLLFFTSCGNKTENSQDTQENKPSGKANIELNGQLSNSSGETLKLYYSPTEGQELIDSTKLDEKGNFQFENIHITHTGFYILKISEQIFCPMILDSNQKITITGDAKNLGNNHTVKGSKDNEIFKEINNKIIVFKRSIDSLGADFQSKMGPTNLNKTGFNDLSKKYEGIYNSFTQKFYGEMIEIINKNPESFACVAAAVQIDPNLYINECNKLYQRLSVKYKNNPTLNSFYSYVKKFSALSNGSEAPEINLQSPEGKNISLSSLKGKYVLVDFWASWCKPCLRDMPDVKNLYSKFKSKGFEILGVSLDENKDQWLGAISSNGLPWLHVSDLGGWKSSAARTYDVTSIPFTVLVDREGKIIEKGLRGAALEDKLNQIFSK
jgi:peroxiredoxin